MRPARSYYRQRYRRKSSGRRWARRLTVATVAAVVAVAKLQVPAEAGSDILVTRTGVRTHGSIVTSASTIGWLLTCALSHRLSDDPITAHGVPGGSHLHDFTGNATTNANSTFASMESPVNRRPAATYNGARIVPGTSCNLPTYGAGTAGDTAAYWRP